MWECNNGGQLWTDSATAGISTSGSVPSGFCAMGFASLNIAFIMSLLVDLVFQASARSLMFLLVCKLKKNSRRICSS